MDWIRLRSAASPPVGTSFCRPIGKPCSRLTFLRPRYCLGTAWSPFYPVCPRVAVTRRPRVRHDGVPVVSNRSNESTLKHLRGEREVDFRGAHWLNLSR